MPALRRALALAAVLAGCSEHPFVDAAMRTAYRPPGGARLGEAIAAGTPYVLLGGDLHCHVSPPDLGWHAVRDVAQTVHLARREGLDFVVLTPHVVARFFEDPEARADFLASQAQLRRDIAAARPGALIVLPGFEYTDHGYGHVGAAFADPAAALEGVSEADTVADPAIFFRRYVAQGGVLVVNHPLVSPVASVVPIARADLSWRAWTAPGPLPAEVSALDASAHGFEAYNLAAAHLRDGLIRADPAHTMRATLVRLDAEILARRRRIFPAGGSDSHSHHLRASTFVLSRERSESGVREALLQGRVCVRAPEACSLRVRAQGGRWEPPGASLRAAGFVLVRALGGAIEVFRDGRVVARPASGEVTRVDVGEACSVLRATVGAGASGVVYVNCDFADPLVRSPP